MNFTLDQACRKGVLLAAAAVLLNHVALGEATNGAGAAPATTVQPMELFADEIVAQGEGVKVTRAALDEALITIKGDAAARGQQIPPQALKGIEAQVLSSMISMQILNQNATEADKKAGVETAEEQLDSMRKQAETEENFNRHLKTIGITLDELLKKMTAEATAKAILRRELKVDVTDADVKAFYDENPSKFEKPEMVRAAHILIGTLDSNGEEMPPERKQGQQTLAEKVLKRAKDGEDFGKLAGEFSDDPGSKDRGGEYTFPRGRMLPEFERVAFAQETNQISDLVTTRYGFHIIKTLEKMPAKKIELAEASDDIRTFLEGREIQKQLPAYMEKLEKAAKVEILDAELKDIIEKARAAAKSAAENP